MDIKNLREWGEHLKKCREERGKSVQQAAAIHGVTESTWNNWERGLVKPHGRLLRPVIREWPEVGRD